MLKMLLVGEAAIPMALLPQTKQKSPFAPHKQTGEVLEPDVLSEMKLS